MSPEQIEQNLCKCREIFPDLFWSVLLPRPESSMTLSWNARIGGGDSVWIHPSEDGFLGQVTNEKMEVTIERRAGTIEQVLTEIKERIAQHGLNLEPVRADFR